MRFLLRGKPVQSHAAETIRIELPHPSTRSRQPSPESSTYPSRFRADAIGDHRGRGRKRTSICFLKPQDTLSRTSVHRYPRQPWPWIWSVQGNPSVRLPLRARALLSIELRSTGATFHAEAEESQATAMAAEGEALQLLWNAAYHVKYRV